MGHHRAGVGFPIVVALMIVFAYTFTIGAAPLHTKDFPPDPPQTKGYGYNARSTAIGGGKIKTAFHTKWINYLDEDLTWQKIDPNFVKTATGFSMTRAPFEVHLPLTARGDATFVNKNRWDVMERQLKNQPPLEQTLRALEVADVPGKIEHGNLGWGETQYVVYRNAYPEIAADLIYWVHPGRMPRLRKFIRFQKAIARDVDFRFEIAFAEDVELVNHGRSVTVRAREATDSRANSLHSFYFWDSHEGWSGRRHIDFDITARTPYSLASLTPTADSQTYVLTKYIQASFFQSAELPAFTDTDFYPDEFDAPGATSMDGVVSYVGPDGTAWSTVRNALIGTGASDSGTHFRITTRKCESAIMSRGITDFDTSSLGAGVQIQSATLFLANCHTPAGEGCGSENQDEITVGIVGHIPANPSIIDVSDYSNGMTLDNAVEYAPRAVVANRPNAYTSFSLNADGIAAINPSGNTNFMLRSHFDLDNNNPLCRNRELEIYASEQVGTSVDPLLSVVYTNPDSDGDGIIDDDDVCPNENPLELDADQDGCTDSAAGLIDLIAMLPSDALDDTMKNNLTQKVTAAEQQATKDNICAAIHILEAFQDAVEAQRDKKITDETADFLIAYAANIITQHMGTLSDMGETCSP